MSSQPRGRLLTIWLALAGFFLIAFYLNRSESVSVSSIWKNPILKTGTKESKPNAAIVMLVAPSRIRQAMVAIRNIEDRFNRRLKYPYVILTEAAITEEIQHKVDWITEGRTTFAGLPAEMWGPPDFLDQDRINESVSKIGFTMGYRSMCRFYSGFFWRHPAIARYDWIWRLDTDIEFHCDVPYDPIERMRNAGALYGFVQVARDALWVQPSLAGNISAFLSSHSHLIPSGVNHEFSWRDVGKALRGDGGSEDWTMNGFYNNWEISHRSLWTSELYESFFDYLDHAGGFFYERWGDSLIHSHGVSMSLRPEQVMYFNDMGYEHQHWGFECPSLDRCTCTRDPAVDVFDARAYEWFNATKPT